HTDSIGLLENLIGNHDMGLSNSVYSNDKNLCFWLAKLSMVVWLRLGDTEALVRLLSTALYFPAGDARHCFRDALMCNAPQCVGD
ncbi:hypothetical protein BgiMline_004927, partial [Biomphalaria glabrata]